MTDPAVSADFLAWYAPVHDRFLRYCDSRCLGLQQAEDLVQDAVLSALEQWDQLTQKDRLLAYMIGIVNNRLRNELRSRAVHRRFLAERKRQLNDRLPADPDAALALDELLRAMDQLPEATREAILLHAVSGFSIREVADAQRSTPGAVKTRISRGRKKLRLLLADEAQPASLRQRLRALTTILL